MLKSIEPIRQWMYRNARPLDLARWRLHFEDGSRQDVLRALAAYQNPDGGFGHALEADNWNPNSTPLTTSTALGLLAESKNFDAHEVKQGVLRYLGGEESFTGGLWPATIPSNNEFPRAPWWTHQPGTSAWGFNPSAMLAGFCLMNAPGDSAVYRRAYDVAQRAVAAFLSETGSPDSHEIACYFSLLACIQEAGLQRELRAPELQDKLIQRAGEAIEKDTSKWAVEYVCTPSFFIESPESPLYPACREWMDADLDRIENTRNAEGVWDITWRWAGYEREFAISESWWKGGLVIKNMLLLKNFGRL